MMKNKKLLSLLLTPVLIAAALAVLIVTAGAAEISTWSELYAALQNGGEVQLTASVTRGAGGGNFANEALEVPLGSVVTLDLNGFSVNAASGGCVVTVAQGGSLTVLDGSAGQTGSLTGGSDSSGGGVYLSDGGSLVLAGGSITGNTSGGEGGGVYVDGGNFTMAGGSITGNTAAHHGGGVYLSGSGSFTMTGGSITGNACGGEGGGAYIAGGDFRLSGAPAINGNQKNSAANNVYLASGKKITLAGAMANSAPIGVNTESPAATPDPGAFTVGWSTYMSATAPENRFTSETSGYGIGLSAGGEARLAPYHTIVLQNSGNGTVAVPEKAAEGAVVSLTVTPDSGYAPDTPTVTYTDINDEQQTLTLTHGGGNAYTFVMPGYPSFEANRSVTVNASFVASEPAFRGHALVLSGEIGVRFSMDLAALTQSDKDGSYMVFTVNGQQTQVNTSDAEQLSDGRYQYTCFVNTLQMAEKITAVFHYGTKTAEDQFSVEDYVKYVAAHPGDYTQATGNLAYAIADYGHYAQIFLTEANGIPSGKYASMDTCYTASYNTASVKTAVSGYQLTVNKGTSKLGDDALMRLSFDSETALSVRLTVTDDTPLTATAEWNGNTYYAEKQSDGAYIIKITGIKASQLADVIAITGSAGGDFTAQVSALAYARSILNSDVMNANAKNAVSALYYYWLAADAYRAEASGN